MAHNIHDVIFLSGSQFILGVFCGLLVACNAAPAKLDEVKPIAIVRSASENNADGSYAYR
jgi:hypothetical protein